MGLSTVTLDMTTPASFVESWGATQHCDWRLLDETQLLGTYDESFYRRPSSSKDPKFTRAELSTAFTRYVELCKTREKELLREKIAHDAELDPERLAEQLLQAINQNVRGADVSALLHWLWLVKRKVFERHVSHHLMVVFKGKSGCGKTVLTSKLVEDLKPFVKRDDLRIFGKRDHYYRFTENYVMLFDELAGGKDSDLDAMKDIITAESIEYRKFHTQKDVVGSNICSFLATTNHSVGDVIKDSTGMRRFWEIDCTNLLEARSGINSFGFLSLWKAVDEKRDEGYALPDQLQEAQTELVYKSHLAEILDDMWTDQKDGKKDWVSAINILSFANDKLGTNGYKSVNASDLKKELTNRGYEFKRRLSGGHKQNCYFVPPLDSKVSYLTPVALEEVIK